jgi:replicative DNA helicase
MSSTGHDHLDAEQSVLGSIFLDSDSLNEIPHLEPRDFSIERHQEIFATMRYLDSRNKPIDIVTVGNEYKKFDREDDSGGPIYLTQLAISTPSSANIVYYANIVRSQAIRRRGAEAGRKIVDLSREDYESDEDYFAAIESLIDELRPQEVAKMRRSSETVKDYRAHLKTKAGKMLTGFHQFDRWAQAWRGWLWVLAGRPGAGKTAKALQMAVGIAKQEREIDMLVTDAMDAGVVLFYSQEMPESRLIDRIIASMSGVSYNRIITKGGESGFTEEEQRKIDKAIAEYERLPLFIKDKPGITIDEIRADARRFKKKYGKIAAIFVDYLQIMEIPERKGERRDQAIGRVTKTAKQIALKMDCCFVMLSQLSRASEEREEPKLTDLKESGSIEQDADMVEFLWHNPDDTETGGKVVQSLFAKGRDTGTNRFRLLFQGWLQHFKELEQKEVPSNEQFKKRKTNYKR